jgi:hypothetical protein
MERLREEVASVMGVRSERILPLCLALCAGFGLACGDPGERPPGPFCETLVVLGEGRIDVGRDPNELVGQVASLDALIAVAPSKILPDLEMVRDTLAGARDAGGFLTLVMFADLQDPELAGAEGRVADWVAEECGIQYGEPGYQVGELMQGKTLCPGWPRAASPLTNNRFPYLIDTAGSNYFSTVFWSVPLVPAPPGMIRVERGGRVEFRGEYPHARYFAFHPNDVETNNLKTLVDVDLYPDEGSANPWRRPVPEGVGRRYTAQLVFGPEPEEPLPNTSYVGRRADGGWNPAVFLLYRIYAADQGSLPPNSAGVPLPSITVYDAEGEVSAHFDACDPYPEDYAPPVDETRFPAFPVPDHRAVHRLNALSTASNWGLPIDILANGDVLYLSAPYDRTRGEVLAVRGRKPRTPSRRDGIPLWAPDTDMRMWSACTYNFWNGVANDCKLDEAVAVDERGDYLLVVSGLEHRPHNATPDRGVTWLDGGRFRDGQLSLRMLLRRDPLLVGLRRAIDSGDTPLDIAPFVPQVAVCSRAVFEAEGWPGCSARH